MANDCHHKWVTNLALLPRTEKIIIFISSSPVVPGQKTVERYCPPSQLAYHGKKLNPLHQAQLLLLLLLFRQWQSHFSFTSLKFFNSFISCTIQFLNVLEEIYPDNSYWIVRRGAELFFNLCCGFSHRRIILLL